MTRHDPNIDYPIGDHAWDLGHSYTPMDPKPVQDWVFQSGKYEGERIYDILRKDSHYVGNLLTFLSRKKEAPGLVETLDYLIDEYIAEVPHTSLSPEQLCFKGGDHDGKRVEDVLNPPTGMYVMNIIEILRITGKDPQLLAKLEVLEKKVWDEVERITKAKEAHYFREI